MFPPKQIVIKTITERIALILYYSILNYSFYIIMIILLTINNRIRLQIFCKYKIGTIVIDGIASQRARPRQIIIYFIPIYIRNNCFIPTNTICFETSPICSPSNEYRRNVNPILLLTATILFSKS